MKITVDTGNEFVEAYLSGYEISVISIPKEKRTDLLSIVKKRKDESDALLYLYAYCMCDEASYEAKKDAAEILKSLAENGRADAQRSYGWCLFFGVGTQKNIAAAIEWYKRAAEQGDAYAQCNLGNCYLNGDGYAKNPSAAVELFKKAALQGNERAQCNLGYCYSNGTGVKRDYAEGVKWFQMAAAQGNVEALYELAICYENGEGVPQDYQKAYEYFTASANSGMSTGSIPIADTDKKCLRNNGKK